MSGFLLVLFWLLSAAGSILFVADYFGLPGALIVGALVVFLLAAAGFGVDATREARAAGDNWVIAIGYGILTGVKTLFRFWP